MKDDNELLQRMIDDDAGLDALLQAMKDDSDMETMVAAILADTSAHDLLQAILEQEAMDYPTVCGDTGHRSQVTLFDNTGGKTSSNLVWMLEWTPYTYLTPKKRANSPSEV